MKKLLMLMMIPSLIMVVGCSDDDDPVGPGTNPPVNADAPVLTAIGAQTGFVAELLEVNVSATDADSTVPALSATALPAGATFVDNGDGTGDFAWTPQDADLGSHSVTFYATDSQDANAVDSEVVVIGVTYRGTPTSTFDAATGTWSTVVDASSYDDFMGFSFTSRDTTSSVLSLSPDATGWDIAFRREAIKLNGGGSGSGDVEGQDLGAVDFATVTMADTAGATWVSDEVEYFIDDWYDYNPVTHQLTANGNVYSMVDAEGDNYVKFRIDSLVGAGMPPDMGTVHMTYFYQSTADSRDLSGTTSSAVIPVGMATGYFDFSSGSAVTPANPGNSNEWDLAFAAYNLMQNSGPTGTGLCAAFLAYTELTDPTDIDGFATQPAEAPMFPDIPSSALTNWYNYTGPPLHQLLSHEHVYLIRTEGQVYKLMIESYYANIGGVPTSGWYTFIWSEL